MHYYTMNKNLRDTIMNPQGIDELNKEILNTYNQFMNIQMNMTNENKQNFKRFRKHTYI